MRTQQPAYKLLLLTVMVFFVGIPSGVKAQQSYDEQPINEVVLIETIRIDELSSLVNRDGRPQPGLTTLPALERSRQDSKLTPYGNTYTRLINVTNSNELLVALQTAEPGDYIELEPGIYQGEFIANRSGEKAAPIVLHGSRTSVLQAAPNTAGYGFYLNADYWVLSGFSIQNSAKGLMADEANHNVISGLHVHNIQDEGIHLRKNSSNNIVQYNMIQNTGLRIEEFGEGIYIGSAISNWDIITDGQPDKSDDNQILNNLIGPGISAEGIDIKEGTSGGLVRNNTFISDGNKLGDSWIDIKGNNYLILGNAGIRPSSDTYNEPFPVFEITPEWGQNNTIEDNEDIIFDGTLNQPFRVLHANSGSSNIVLPERPIRYTIAEIITRFPLSFDQLASGTFLLKEHIIVGPGASLSITDLDGLYLLSSEEHLTSITGQQAEIKFESVAPDSLQIQSWHPDGYPSEVNIRSYVALRGGVMNAHNTSFTHLGFTGDMFAGVTWMGYVPDLTQPPLAKITGNITDSEFKRNYYGAYTWEAEDMTWTNNVFANNERYGFNGSDYSTGFTFTNNLLQDNGDHGIIFSRGSIGHNISNNDSLRNRGNGIMLDNGQLYEPDITRYDKTAPSIENIVTNNTIANNVDGIVLEDSSDNEVQYNTILGLHRYGIRLNDKANDNLIELNQIEGVERHNIYIYATSNNNRVLGNDINGGRTGIAIDTSENTTIEQNIIHDLRGTGITLDNEINKVDINNNQFSGSGFNVIRLRNNTTLNIEALVANNDITNWRFPPPAILAYPTLFTWLLIFLVPIITKLFVMTRHRYGHRYELKL